MNVIFNIKINKAFERIILKDNILTHSLKYSWKIKKIVVGNKAKMVNLEEAGFSRTQ